MKTVVIIRKGWTQIAEFDFLVPMSSGDLVQYKDFDYKVSMSCLNVDKNQLEILVEE